MTASSSPLMAPLAGFRLPKSRLWAAAIVLVLIGAAIGVALPSFRALTGSRAVRPNAYRDVRTKTIAAQLDQVEGDYLLVLGDSHAERLFLPQYCGLPVVDAGVSGATVSDVLDLARSLQPRRQPRGVLVSVGTNDIWIKRQPESESAVRLFRAGLAGLQATLARWTDKVTLLAIPPVAERQESEFPRAAAQRYSAMLREACTTGRCRFVSPFEAAAASDMSRDGVHMRDYARFMRAMEPEICAGVTGRG